jgi:hypothetical protein
MLKTVGFPSTRTGDQTIVNGNLVIGTAGKGIDFSAAGGDTLTMYDEGTWTPVDTSGAGLTLTNEATATYTRIGRMVVANYWVKYPVTASGAGANIGGLPFTSASGVSGSVVINQTEYAVPFHRSRSARNCSDHIFLLSATRN